MGLGDHGIHDREVFIDIGIASARLTNTGRTTDGTMVNDKEVLAADGPVGIMLVVKQAAFLETFELNQGHGMSFQRQRREVG